MTIYTFLLYRFMSKKSMLWQTFRKFYAFYALLSVNKWFLIAKNQKLCRIKKTIIIFVSKKWDHLKSGQIYDCSSHKFYLVIEKTLLEAFMWKREHCSYSQKLIEHADQLLPINSSNDIQNLLYYCDVYENVCWVRWIHISYWWFNKS